MSIARVTTALALSLLAVQLASGVAVACDNPGKTHNLKFKVKNDECVEKVKKEKDDGDADTINVCETDKVVWKVAGRAKTIVFEGESPVRLVGLRFRQEDPGHGQARHRR